MVCVITNSIQLQICTSSTVDRALFSNRGDLLTSSPTRCGGLCSWLFPGGFLLEVPWEMLRLEVSSVTCSRPLFLDGAWPAGELDSTFIHWSSGFSKYFLMPSFRILGLFTILPSLHNVCCISGVFHLWLLATQNGKFCVVKTLWCPVWKSDVITVIQATLKIGTQCDDYRIIQSGKPLSREVLPFSFSRSFHKSLSLQSVDQTLCHWHLHSESPGKLRGEDPTELHTGWQSSSP